MNYQIENKTFQWLKKLQIINQSYLKSINKNTCQLTQQTAKLFENGVIVSQIVKQLYKKKGIPIPVTINHLKQSNQTAAQLYNWNIINDALKKIGFQIDSETKNMIINGDFPHLQIIIRKLQKLYLQSSLQQPNDVEDSLETNQMKLLNSKNIQNTKNYDKLQKVQKLDQGNQFQYQGKESLQLSHSQDPQNKMGFISNTNKNLQNMLKQRQSQNNISLASGNLLEYIIKQLMQFLKLTRKQALALLSQNNKYLAHVLVKGVKGQFLEIQQMMQKFYKDMDFIIQKMMEQNDMCFFFLQVIKPSLLSKSEQIAQWGCRILSKIGFQLAEKQMLPLAYDWFVRQAGGLSTTILALQRHPKLNQHVVGYILQFARYNVAELFTIQLKKITNNDTSGYLRFILLIFDPLIQSKTSSQELLSSGAIDYWVQICMKNAQPQLKKDGSIQLRLISIQLLIKIWRAYPIHIQQTLDQVNNIMNQIKKGIRQSSQIMRFTLIQMMFNLLDQFASRKNPYASIVYKKLTFLFIQNHQELTMREFMLRNFSIVFQKYPTIPVDIFLQPFVKQVKISQSKSYLVNIFDFQFIDIAVRHKKLKITMGLQLYDLLAKTKLNSYSFAKFAQDSMDILLDRFLDEQIFIQYTLKLVKISLAMLYSTLKNKKQFNDQQRLQAQKRAQVINFIISLIQRGNNQLNQEIKDLVIHVKVQIYNRLGIQHKGIQRILGYYNNIQQAVKQAFQNIKDQTQSNVTSQQSRNQFHLPKITGSRHMYKDKDQTTSQQSLKTSSSKFSRQSKQEFPQKDYSQFVTQDQKKFLKDHGMGLKKKPMSNTKRVPSYQKQVNPKLQQQINKMKERKQQQLKKKARQQQITQKRKQVLKQKIQKQLQIKNLKHGVKGNQKDVEVKMIYGDNQINQKIIQEDQDQYKILKIDEFQNRHTQSIKLVLKKYSNFIRKVFSRYSIAKSSKKQYFNEEGQYMNQVDLLKFCKQKNLEKSKQAIIQMLKIANDKNVQNIEIEGFFKFLQVICLSTAQKQKFGQKQPMGQLMKSILKRIAVGQKTKLQEQEDEVAKALTQKIQNSGHFDLPDNYKKISQKVYIWHNQITYPVQRAIKQEKFLVCYSALSDILKDIFDFHLVQEQVRFTQQIKVVSKKQAILPPKPLKKERQDQSNTLNFKLQDKQTVPVSNTNNKLTKSGSASHRKFVRAGQSIQKQNRSQSKQKIKPLNAVERKKLEQQQLQLKQKQQQQQLRKQRQKQLKKKLQLQQQQYQHEKQRKKQENKQLERKQEQKKLKQKQQKQRYLKQQKDKVQKFKKQQETKQKLQKKQQQQQRVKQDEEKKEKLRIQMKKQQQRRKDQYQKIKKQRQAEASRQKKRIEQQQKKKEKVKNQVMKKLQNQKEKLQTNKLQKQLLKKLYNQPEVSSTFQKYKQEMKGLFNYGTEYNQFKLNKGTHNQLEQKGWIAICQQLSICDTSTANKLLKLQLRQKGRGFSLQQMQETLLSIAVKKQLESDLQNYDGLKTTCGKKIDTFLNGLKIPKDKQTIRDFFVFLKNQKNKQQINITGPNGQKQTWQIQQQK